MATPKQTDPQFKLRLPAALKQQIENSAADNNRSMNAEIVARLETWDDLKTEVSFLSAVSLHHKTERDRLEAELEYVQSQLALKIDLPQGLSTRVSRAAADNERTLTEEVTQALEALYPPPASVFEFIRDVLDPLSKETDPVKIRAMAAEANRVAAERGWGEVSTRFDEKGDK